MRSHSAAMIKRNIDPKNDLPLPGSLARFVYDLFYEYRGTKISRADRDAMVELVGSKSLYFSIINNLVDTWGCDIRKQILVGEWCGRTYIDYVAERVVG